MCGRFAQSSNQKKMMAHFKIKKPASSFALRYNIAPLQMVPVVIQAQEERVFAPMRWGLIPSWGKDPTIANRMINARLESVRTKPSFRSCLKQKRCLIPATGFYEWRAVKGNKGKIPMWISLKNQDIFAFAGLWDEWLDPQHNKIQTFTIITTEANSFLQSIHSRMPVILEANAEDSWLEPSIKDSQQVLHNLKQVSVDLMQAHAVSAYVNSPKNEGIECIHEAPDPEQDLTLF